MQCRSSTQRWQTQSYNSQLKLVKKLLGGKKGQNTWLVLLACIQLPHSGYVIWTERIRHCSGWIKDSHNKTVIGNREWHSDRLYVDIVPFSPWRNRARSYRGQLSSAFARISSHYLHTTSRSARTGQWLSPWKGWNSTLTPTILTSRQWHEHSDSQTIFFHFTWSLTSTY